MRKIAFINNKGGVGKTASVTTMAHMLWKLHGKKVLVVDMDPQSNASAMFTDTLWMNLMFSILPDEFCALSSEQKDDLYRAEMQEKLASLPKDWTDDQKREYLEELQLSVEDLLLDNDMDPHRVIRHTKYEGLDIIQAQLTLAEAEGRLKADVVIPQQYKLREQLKKIEDEYDYCLIDCSPSISLLNINALVAADEIYIPMRCDGNSAIGCAISLQLITNVRQFYRPDIKVDGIFFTQYNTLANVSKVVEELLASIMTNVEILPFKIGRSKLLEENTYEQLPLLDVDAGKNKTKVTLAYMDLVEYIMAPNKKKFLKEYQQRTVEE